MYGVTPILLILQEVDLKNHRWGHYFICGWDMLYCSQISRSLPQLVSLIQWKQQLCIWKLYGAYSCLQRLQPFTNAQCISLNMFGPFMSWIFVFHLYFFTICFLFVCVTLFFLISVLKILLIRYKGLYEYAKSKGLDVGSPVGLDVLVDGTVPTGIVWHVPR